MSDSLKAKTISGIKWSGLEKIFQQVLVFGAGIFLARKLFDTDYGLVAVLSIFTFMANALQDSGFPSALIRKRDANDVDYSTVFYFNIGIGISLYLILFFCAPLISDYYNEPSLTALARVTFLSFVFNSLGAIQSVQIIKAINYKLNTKINIISIFTSYTVALTLAYNNFGAWAIVGQMVSYSALRTLLLWLWNRWRPMPVFSKTSFLELFNFGSKLLVKSILDTTVSRITPSLIGKYFGFAPAGNYDQGNRIYSSGLDLLNGTVLSVAFPVLSAIEDEDRLKKIYRKLTRVIAFLTFPFFTAMLLLASPFILGVLGEKWIQSIPVLQLLAVSGIFYSLNAMNIHIIKVKGKSSYLLWIEVVRLVLVIITIALTILLGKSYLYIVLGLTVISIINYILNSLATYKLIHYKIGEQIKDIIPYFVISIIAGILAYAVSFIIDNQLILLISQALVIAIVYTAITYISGSTIIKEAMGLIKFKKGF